MSYSIVKAVVPLVLSAGVWWKAADLEASETTRILIGVGVLVTISLGLLAVVYLRIQSLNRKETVQTTEDDIRWVSPMDIARGKNFKTLTVSQKEYDTAYWQSAVVTFGVQFVLALLIWEHWDSLAIMVLSSVFGFLEIAGTPVVRVHVFGSALPRPWRAGMMAAFSELMVEARRELKGAMAELKGGPSGGARKTNRKDINRQRMHRRM